MEVVAKLETVSPVEVVINPLSLVKNPRLEGRVNMTVAPDEVTFQSPLPVEVEKVNAGPVAVPPPEAMVEVAGAEVANVLQVGVPVAESPVKAVPAPQEVAA